ncbi:MAG: ribosomal protein S18-alanine N-acetyltransferase [Chloroflexota bacterium]|nr:ribosomal protein S18-alanine N-acetyltransferase [Chloroflexota bacterium]
MTTADVPEVGRIERRCFANPWPASAYRRELQVPAQNHYVVLREIAPPALAEAGAIAAATEENGAHGERSLPRRTLLPLAFGRKLGRPMEESGDGLPILGFAGMWLAFDEAHVTTIGVDPEVRGRGLGELLLVAMFDEAFRRHTNWLTLEVRVSNAPAQMLYQKYGFHEQGRRKRYYSDNNEDALIMWSEPLSDPAFQGQIERLRDQLFVRLEADPADLGLSPALPNGRRP